MTPPRLIFVTGKGGTGKSTVSAALACQLSGYRPTTLADLDRQLSAIAMLKPVNGHEGGPQGDAPFRITDTLEAVALSPRAELESFMRRMVPVAAVSRRMLRSRTFGYVTAALPGLEAFLLLERLRIMAGDAALNDRYVVVDAPATGTALELLTVASGVKGIAPVGSLARLALGIETLLTDSNRFGVIITVTPEELAVSEALELAAALKNQLAIAPLCAIVNRTPAAVFRTPELCAIADAPGLEAHLRLARRREDDRANARRALRRLADAKIDSFELPMLYSARIGPAEVAQLGAKLAPILKAS